MSKELFYKLMKEFNGSEERFKIKVDVRHQESKHIAIWLYMTLDQSDDLINCIEASGEISLDLLQAFSDSIRKGDLQLQEDMPKWEDDFLKRWEI